MIQHGCSKVRNLWLIDLVKNKPQMQVKNEHLTVGLGYALDLVLLLNSIAVGGATSSIDDLVGEALGDCLDVAER